MTEDLKLLVDLQDIDTVILRKTAVVEAIPRKVSSAEQPLRDAKTACDKCRQKLEALTKKKKEKEQLLEDTNDKIRKLKSRVSEIKTNKEYQAHLKEVEAVERERLSVEDEILSAMEALDASQREVNAFDERVRSEEERLNAFRRKLQEEVAAVQEEVSNLRLRKERVLNTVDKELYGLYKQLFETKRGLAVVETRGEVCQGCNMNIPPQLFVAIKKSEKIIQCPQCARILYWNPEKSHEE